MPLGPILIILFQLVMAQFAPTRAQQACTPTIESTVESLLEVAQIHELNRDWERAVETYGQVSVSPCQTLATEGQKGLQRSLEKQSNWLNKLREQLQNVLLTVVSQTIQITLIIVPIILVGSAIIKAILYYFARNDTWSIWPFNDLTNQKLGDDVAELLVMNLHEIRFWHSKETTRLISLADNVDLPIFSDLTPMPGMLSALSNLEKLGVGGIELPVGSMISFLRAWLNLDGYRILGNIQQAGDTLVINARLETGRQNKCLSIWKQSAVVTEEQKVSEALSDLIRDLSYSIILDIVPEAWGTRSEKALQKFTDGIKCLDEYERSHLRPRTNLIEARQLFESALQIDPTYQLATYNIALAELNLSHYEEAISLLKSLQPTEYTHFAAEIDYNLGIAYYQRTQDWAYVVSEQAFERVVATFTRHPKAAKERELLCLSHCGLVCLTAQYTSRKQQKEEYWKMGQSHYQMAMALADDNPELIAYAQYSLALLHLNRKEPEQAIALLKSVLNLNPYHGRAYTALGQAFLSQKQYSMAIAELSKAVIFSPSYEYAHYLLGRAYSMNEQPDLALDAFSRAGSISRAHDERGRILALEYQKFDEAIIEFEKAIKLNSRLADAHANLAWFMCEGASLDDDNLSIAQKHALQAVNLTSRKSWHKLAVLGRVYYEAKKFRDARLIFMESQQLAENQPQVLYYLGLIEKTEGNMDAALGNFNQLMQLPEAKTTKYWQDKAMPIIRNLERT